jgi:hypothetical protein
MSKLNFKNQPTQEEVQNFIDLIEYNRSQRNKEKEFLMHQFEIGNIIIEDNRIKVISDEISNIMVNLTSLIEEFELKKIVEKFNNKILV